RLMAGADKGDDVVLDLSARKPLGALGAQEQCEEVLRSIRLATGKLLLPQFHRARDDVAKESERVPPKYARDSRKPVRRAEKIERIDPAHRLEQAVHLMRETAGVARDLAGKKRFGEDVEGEHRHVARD